MNQKKYILVAALIFTVSTILACNIITPTQPQSSGFPTENPHLDVQRVTLEEAKAAFDSGSAIFLDVRSAGSYAQGHIPGAISIPASELPSRLGELDPNQWIITYCT